MADQRGVTGLQVVGTSGSVSVISDGRTTRVYLSANWSGIIECDGRMVVHRERARQGLLRRFLGNADQRRARCAKIAADCPVEDW